MIFVTVGTHEQQFNRLVEYMDKWASLHDEEVVIQTGYSTYEPQNCRWQKMFSYIDMSKNVDDARIIITHGGPSSFIAPLQVGKTPIVVPRRHCFDEHVNNHQVKFCKEVENRMGNIIVVEDIEKLEEVIAGYDKFIGSSKSGITNNNAKFCEEFEIMVDRMFRGEK